MIVLDIKLKYFLLYMVQEIHMTKYKLNFKIINRTLMFFTLNLQSYSFISLHYTDIYTSS